MIMRKMLFRLLCRVAILLLTPPQVLASASSDSPRDVDIAQTSYVGGDHGISPEDIPRFKHLWNATFEPDEKHWARPLIHTLSSTGRQIVFTASTDNRVRTFDAATGEILNERQVAPPWPMDAAYCTEHVSKRLGVMGTPVVDTDGGMGMGTGRGDVVYFWGKSGVDNYRVSGGVSPPLNAVYSLYALSLDTLLDLPNYPLLIDALPFSNDPRKTFLGGLVLQRPSLLLLNNTLYTGFGGLCDAFNYTGAIIAVDLATRDVELWTTEAGPDSGYADDWTAWHGGGAGAVWMAGMGLASDGRDVWFLVDNGAGSTGGNVSMSAIEGRSAGVDVLTESVARVRLKRNGNDADGGHGVGGGGVGNGTKNGKEKIVLVDFFRPADYQTDAGQDIGSGGIALLPLDIFSTQNGKRIGIATSTNTKMYILDADNLGGYRTGPGGSDGILQTIPLAGETFGGVGVYPLEGGYVYVNPGNDGLLAFKFNPQAPNSNSNSSSRSSSSNSHTTSNSTAQELFTLAGRSSIPNAHWGGAGAPTVTSFQSQPGTGIVWMTDVQRGLRAFRAVPVNGNLVELTLPEVQGAVKFGRPVFGNGRVYVVDGKSRLICLGVE